MDSILVTGGAGYIGSVLCRRLLNSGYRVVILDNFTFAASSISSIRNNPNLLVMNSDIRDSESLKQSLDNINYIVHLCAIVGDPACSKNPQLAEEINWLASKKLFDLASENKSLRGFIFASTCSNYGRMLNEEYLDENSELRPLSLYAKLKVKFERYIRDQKPTNGMYTTSLRFATAYGLSPRMRFDLTVNEFIREVTLENELVVYGEQFWRPYCHTEDISRACELILQSGHDKVNNQVFGIGHSAENYTKEMIINEIKKVVSEPKIKYVKMVEDPRDYKVNFSKIEKMGFKNNYKLLDGIKEINNAIVNGQFEDPYLEMYKNS